MSRANKSSYKWLKSRSNAKKSKKREFDQRFNSTLERLFPRTAPTQKSDSKNYDKLIKNLEDNYNKKLTEADKNNRARLAAQEEQSNAMAESFGKQLDAANARVSQLSKGVQDAVKRLTAEKQQQSAPESTRQANGAENSQISDSQRLQLPEYEQYTTPTKTEDLTEKVTEKATTEIKEKDEPVKTTEVTEKVVKKTLAIGDVLDFGEYRYRATNLYGLRKGKNSVAGRRQDEHSRGVDLVSHDKSGKAVNLPIAISNGVIKSIRRQGSGKAILPTQGKEAGYMIDVVAPNGKMITYAHVSPKVAEMADQLIGKQVKRGDVLLNDGGFSGSGTGKHVKIFMSDVDKEGKSKRNYIDEGNDPTNLILTGKYL